MKCPFCQQELRNIHPTYVICDNCRITGEDKLWQALIDSMKEHDLCHDALVERTKEQDRIRKALDVAVNAMKISNEIVYSAYGSPLKTLKDALEQIKALEQKDVK